MFTFLSPGACSFTLAPGEELEAAFAPLLVLRLRRRRRQTHRQPKPESAQGWVILGFRNLFDYLAVYSEIHSIAAGIFMSIAGVTSAIGSGLYLRSLTLILIQLIDAFNHQTC
ncbi:hypothetical protein B0T10DRAFT_556681 [Thelonectria olida]|uniref:Uncharacterized protein n=1 Tax=Thelonectria olida TaxID=1576542 RepID=A0A9P8WD57_9HYPO|nr:hypothetical protein B0T10DRAFT_556681 [Thelonectria olida]